MEKSKLIWMNGEFVNWEDATVSVMSHTLHYGTGVFEGIRARECPKGTSIFYLFFVIVSHFFQYGHVPYTQ